MFSLANKQDRDGAIDDEDSIKRKLNIDRLKIKHKIVSYIIIFERSLIKILLRNYVRQNQKIVARKK